LHGTCSPQVFMLTLQNFRKKVQQNISPRSRHRFILQNGQSPVAGFAGLSVVRSLLPHPTTRNPNGAAGYRPPPLVFSPHVCPKR
jgi:hypothetical protein